MPLVAFVAEFAMVESPNHRASLVIYIHHLQERSSVIVGCELCINIVPISVY